MKKILSLAVFALTVAVIAPSCGKYEDGPGLSLRSKKGRIAGEWQVSKYLYDGTDQTSSVLPSGTTYTLTVEKGGSWTSTITFSGGSDTDAGTWEFVDKKEKLKMVTTGSSDTDGDTSVITMLKNKEMHLKSTYGGHTTEIYYTAK